VDAANPFDLTATPLVRATLYRLSERDHVLAFCFYHIILDGWSEGIFRRELAAFYDADSEACGLEELPIQYADFAIWQREQKAGGAAESSHAYWKRQLADAPAALNFPLDAPRPVEPSHRGRLEVMTVPAPTLDALLATGPDARCHAVHDAAGGL
jgi:Condensation domain